MPIKYWRKNRYFYVFYNSIVIFFFIFSFSRSSCSLFGRYAIPYSNLIYIFLLKHNIIAWWIFISRAWSHRLDYLISVPGTSEFYTLANRLQHYYDMAVAFLDRIAVNNRQISAYLPIQMQLLAIYFAFVLHRWLAFRRWAGSCVCACAFSEQKLSKQTSS